MLDFSDAPYQFFPAKPNPFIMWFCRQVVRRLALPGRNHRLREVVVEGETESLRELARDGARILYVPNHSTHSDPQLMADLQHRFDTPSCFMAAYDVFLRSKLQAWVMQRNGAFSVDREGSDRKSMAAAMEILREGRFALTIFPEGNVYLMNDRVTPFLDGASFLALKAQKDLGPEKPVHVVPISIKLTHLTDVRSEVRQRLDEIAAVVGAEVDHDSDPLEELISVGRLLLFKNLRQRGYLSRDEEFSGDDISSELKDAAERIVAGLEEKIDLKPKPKDNLTDRVRRIRGAIHQIRTDADQELEHRVASSWSDEAILALRILSYSNPYTAENPTLDRFSETVEKISEDLRSEWQRPIADRKAILRVGKPIDLTSRLEDFGRKARNAIIRLTRDMESTVQDGLDAINANHQSEGSKPCKLG